MRQPAFWEISDAPAVPTRDTVITRISAAEVDALCRQYHYTGRAGTAAWRWGLWAGNALIGAVAYNLPTDSLCRTVFGVEHRDKVWHMGRLAMHDDAPRNSESRLIGASLREITRDYPEVWAILTYADTDQGHVGYVYQATNALYTGMGGRSAVYVDQDGMNRGAYQNGKTITNERAREMGWRRNGQSAGKHRYVYVLGNRKQRRERLSMLRYPVLPYPKGNPAPVVLESEVA